MFGLFLGAKDNINNTIMVMESDSGTFQAVGLEYSGKACCFLRVNLKTIFITINNLNRQLSVV